MSAQAAIFHSGSPSCTASPVILLMVKASLCVAALGRDGPLYCGVLWLLVDCLLSGGCIKATLLRLCSRHAWGCGLTYYFASSEGTVFPSESPLATLVNPTLRFIVRKRSVVKAALSFVPGFVNLGYASEMCWPWRRSVGSIYTSVVIWLKYFPSWSCSDLTLWIIGLPVCAASSRLPVLYT